MANTSAISPIMWQQAAHTTCRLSSHIILCLHGWNKLLAATTYPTYKITRLQIGRQTKCITALTHHPLANSQNVSPYLHTTNSWTGRQTKSITVVTYHWCVNSQIDKMYHHTHTPPTYEQADRQTKCITTPTLPTHEQADRQTKCITTLSHHPFTVRHTKCITISWTGRQTDKMYYHTRTSPSHKQTLRQTDWRTKCITVLTHRPLANSQTDRQNMYHCTHTSPTCEQSDRQTKYVSLYSHGPSDSLNDLNGGPPAGQVGCMHADPCAGANCRKNGHTKNLPGLVKVHHQPITQTRLIDCTLSGQGYTN